MPYKSGTENKFDNKYKKEYEGGQCKYFKKNSEKLSHNEKTYKLFSSPVKGKYINSDKNDSFKNDSIKNDSIKNNSIKNDSFEDLTNNKFSRNFRNDIPKNNYFKSRNNSSTPEKILDELKNREQYVFQNKDENKPFSQNKNFKTKTFEVPPFENKNFEIVSKNKNSEIVSKNFEIVSKNKKIDVSCENKPFNVTPISKNKSSESENSYSQNNVIQKNTINQDFKDLTYYNYAGNMNNLTVGDVIYYNNFDKMLYPFSFVLSLNNQMVQNKVLSMATYNKMYFFATLNSGIVTITNQTGSINLPDVFGNNVTVSLAATEQFLYVLVVFSGKTYFYLISPNLSFVGQNIILNSENISPNTTLISTDISNCYFYQRGKLSKILNNSSLNFILQDNSNNINIYLENYSTWNARLINFYQGQSLRQYNTPYDVVFASNDTNNLYLAMDVNGSYPIKISWLNAEITVTERSYLFLKIDTNQVLSYLILPYFSCTDKYLAQWIKGNIVLQGDNKMVMLSDNLDKLYEMSLPMSSMVNYNNSDYFLASNNNFFINSKLSFPRSVGFVTNIDINGVNASFNGNIPYLNDFYQNFSRNTTYYLTIEGNFTNDNSPDNHKIIFTNPNDMTVIYNM